MKLNKKVNSAKALEIYKKFYKTEPFVRITENEAYSTKSVFETNFCDIGMKINEEKGLLIVVSMIDNLIKGASGQAVQNMNIMYGFPEESGL
jgi:N-acetyl-gamma-glutamyl-phosphate reductase